MICYTLKQDAVVSEFFLKKVPLSPNPFSDEDFKENALKIKIILLNFLKKKKGEKKMLKYYMGEGLLSKYKMENSIWNNLVRLER